MDQNLKVKCEVTWVGLWDLVLGWCFEHLAFSDKGYSEDPLCVLHKLKIPWCLKIAKRAESAVANCKIIKSYTNTYIHTSRIVLTHIHIKCKNVDYKS